jgi:hypothetical protein
VIRNGCGVSVGLLAEVEFRKSSWSGCAISAEDVEDSWMSLAVQEQSAQVVSAAGSPQGYANCATLADERSGVYAGRKSGRHSTKLRECDYE